MPTFGCAYWGRDAGVAERDLASLPELGFSWVVVPVSTERMRYDRAGAAAVIAAAKRHGLATRIAPWGVGGIFGGEGIVEAGRITMATLAWWLSSAHELEPDAMFWDEPHGAPGLRAMTEAMTTLAHPRRRAVPLHQPGSQRLARAAGDDVTGRHRHRCLPLAGGRHRAAAGGARAIWPAGPRLGAQLRTDEKTDVAAGARPVRLARRGRCRHRDMGLPLGRLLLPGQRRATARLDRDHGDDRAPRRSPGGLMS